MVDESMRRGFDTKERVMFRDISGKLVIVVFTLVAVMVSATNAQTVWYVDDSSTSGLNDGSDWANAFVELQAALAVATTGDEIRVGQGVYTPDFDVNSNGHSGDREASFQLISGVKLCGGYAGVTEVDPDVRNVALYETVLSGDLAGNDEPDFVNREDNSCCMVVADFVDSNARLDGFSIQGVQCDSSCHRCGGIILNSSDPYIVSCSFIKSGITLSSSDSHIVGCSFIGSGLRNDNSSPVISSCRFIRNSWKCVENKENSNPLILNCTFVGNHIEAGGPFAYVGVGVSSGDDCNPVISNCIFWGNSSGNNFGEKFQIFSRSGSNPLITNCCIEGLDTYSGNGNFCIDPLVTRNGHLRKGSPCIDRGNLGRDYTSLIDVDGEARISGAGIDIGADEFIDSDNDEIPDWWENKYFGSILAAENHADVDEDGRVNVVEYRDSTDPVVVPVYCFVSTAGNDAWDGLAADWDGVHGPKATIKAAIEVADPDVEGQPNMVIIQPGVYFLEESLGFSGKAVVVRSSAPEDPLVVENTVIESISGWGVTFHEKEQPDSVLYGFNVRGGGIEVRSFSSPTILNCVFTGSSSFGAVYLYYSDAVLSNCVFENNATGVYLSGGAPLLTDCVFRENTRAIYNSCGSPKVFNGTFVGNSAQEGAAVFNDYFCHHGRKNPVFTACTFSNNTAVQRGGGLMNSGNMVTEINQCVFRHNDAGEGGAIYNSYGKNTKLVNCTLSENTGDSLGGGIYFRNGHLELVNCILWGNADSNGLGESGQIAYDTLMPVVTSSCIQGLDMLSGNGNIGENPLFVDSNGLDGIPGTEDDDLRLRAGSPCINGGDNSAVPVGVSTDLDGLPRVHACIVDMGAYEYQENRYYGDADENCVVDLADYLDFSFCLDRFGVERNPILDVCIEVFDADGDKDVDLADFAEFQRVFTEEG